MLKIQKFDTNEYEKANEFIASHSMKGDNDTTIKDGAIFLLYEEGEVYSAMDKITRLKQMLFQFRKELLESDIDVTFWTAQSNQDEENPQRKELADNQKLLAEDNSKKLQLRINVIITELSMLGCKDY